MIFIKKLKVSFFSMVINRKDSPISVLNIFDERIKYIYRNTKMEKEEIFCHHGSLSEGKDWKQPKMIASSI
jgi:hypothetical protein